MSSRNIVFACAAGMLILLSGAGARAESVDFSCSLSLMTPCSGTILQSGSNYSSNGIDVFNDSGPYNSSVPFELMFNTATGVVKIDGTGIYAGQDLVGEMTGFSTMSGHTTTDVSFTAVWPTIPPLVQAQLGSLTGTDSGFVIALKGTGSAQSVDVLITSTPEPGSLAMLFAGLAAIGASLRRRLL